MIAAEVRMVGNDEQHPKRRRKSPSGLKDVKKYLDVENENIEEHQRENGHAKITQVDPHHDLITRVDRYDSVEALARVEAKLPRKKWLCFVACEFGMVEDARGILRVHRALIPGLLAKKPRDLSFEEVAAYYRLAAETVKVYDQEGRREYQVAFDAILHEPKRSLWWGALWGEMDRRQ